MKQEIHFVTGKGGVGKSLVAAALAFKVSQTGKRVLLVELGEKSFFEDFYSLPPVGFKPIQLKENISVALWSGEDCLRDYAKHLIKVEKLVNLFFANPVMRVFVNVAPALKELAILGKITSGPRKHGPAAPFDCLVVDAFATGHFLALLEAPKGMAQAVQIGPMGEQSRGIVKTLQDSEYCQYHLVTLPEDLPAKEALELYDNLKANFSVEADVLVNKVLKTDMSVKKLEDEDSDLFIEFLRSKLQKQEEILEQLKARIKDVKVLPQLFDHDPWKLTQALTEKL